MIGKTLYSPVREEIKYFINSKLNKQYIVADTITIPPPAVESKGLLARAFNFKQVEVLAPSDPEFSIVVPKIGANAKIFSNTNSPN